MDYWTKYVYPYYSVLKKTEEEEDEMMWEPPTDQFRMVCGLRYKIY